MTGLQFAVLRAYAASLPKTCPTRAKLAHRLRADLPGEAQRRTGRVLAFASGLLSEDGRTLTREGLRAVLAYLPRFDSKGARHDGVHTAKNGREKRSAF